MVKAVKVTLNQAGMRQLLRSPEVEGELKRRAQMIAADAGPGHGVDADTGSTRARAWVWTQTYAAMKAEATSRDLTAAIDAGGG